VTLATAKLLVGRTIIAVDLQPFDDCNDAGKKIRTCYAPVLTLDNGARVRFSVDETNNGDVYGIRPDYYPNRGSK
jgi:hypothetical protein